MTTIYLDTATSDRWLFRRGKEPAPPDEQQPHMVRLAWQLEADDGNTIRDACHLIKLPTGVKMAGEAAHHTGIYDHHLNEHGRSMSGVLGEFADALGEAGLVVAHSWAFHRQVLERSFRYLGWPAREWQPNVCTMIALTPIVQVPRMQPGGGYKWPSFEEACERGTGSKYLPSMNPVTDGLERIRLLRAFHGVIKALR